MYQERDYEIIDYELFRLPERDTTQGSRPATLAPGRVLHLRRGGSDVRLLLREAVSRLARGAPRPAGAEFRLRRERGRASSSPSGSARVRQRGPVRRRPGHVRPQRGQLGLRHRGARAPQRRSDGERIGAEPAYRELLETEGPERVASRWSRRPERTGSRAIRGCSSAIEVPTILFWFSRARARLSRRTTSDICVVFGEFPQLVNRGDGRADQAARATTTSNASRPRGLPQPLVSRFTGEPVSIIHRADLGTGWDGSIRITPPLKCEVDGFDALVESCLKFARPTKVT